MEHYFSETTIRIAPESGEEITLIMRPLKVKELPDLLRLEARAASGDGEATIAGFADFIDLVDGTVDGDIKALPTEALDGIIKAFDGLNFPAGAKKGKASKKPFDEKEFARSIEFLISQGHAFSEIEEYTLPRFRLFVDLAIERLTAKPKKKVDPMEALAGLGIPMRQ